MRTIKHTHKIKENLIISRRTLRNTHLFIYLIFFIFCTAKKKTSYFELNLCDALCSIHNKIEFNINYVYKFLSSDNNHTNKLAIKFYIYQKRVYL